MLEKVPINVSPQRVAEFINYVRVNNYTVQECLLIAAYSLIKMHNREDAADTFRELSDSIESGILELIWE